MAGEGAHDADGTGGDRRHDAVGGADVVDPVARVDYAGEPLDDAAAARGPLALLQRWYADAVADDRVAEAGAMVVATVDASGAPDARTVLLKAMDARGLVFYTNLGSVKARQLAAHPAAAVVLPWHAMSRTVRLRGVVEVASRQEAAEYFATRSRQARLGAWASRQSEPLAARADLDAALEDASRRWPGDDDVPLPGHWGGYRVRPVEVELWTGRASRLHDRLVLTSRDGTPAPLDDVAAWRAWRRQP